MRRINFVSNYTLVVIFWNCSTRSGPRTLIITPTRAVHASILPNIFLEFRKKQEHFLGKERKKKPSFSHCFFSASWWLDVSIVSRFPLVASFKCAACKKKTPLAHWTVCAGCVSGLRQWRLETIPVRTVGRLLSSDERERLTEKREVVKEVGSGGGVGGAQEGDRKRESFSSRLPHTTHRRIARSLKCCLSSSPVYCVWPTAGSFASCCPLLWEITSLSPLVTLECFQPLSVPHPHPPTLPTAAFSASATGYAAAFWWDFKHTHTHSLKALFLSGKMCGRSWKFISLQKKWIFPVIKSCSEN